MYNTLLFYTSEVNLSKISLIILAAGNSTRYEDVIKKQWLRIDTIPLWKFVTQKLSCVHPFEKIVVTGHPNEIHYMDSFATEELIVAGGDTRQQSLQNALRHIDSEFVMVSDVARACIPHSVVSDIISAKEKADCIVPYISTADTTIVGNTRVNRDDVKLIQTPQLSRTDILKKAMQSDGDFTDDSGAIENIGGTIHYVVGSVQSAKLTRIDDLKLLSCLSQPSKNFFVGFGYDVHQFETDKPMVLGGVYISSTFGFKAHSDGDVLIHSIIDAILGAAGAGDIGEFFPDTDPQYKNVNSQELLMQIIRFIKNVGYEIVNIDVTIIAEVPKITPYKKAIKENLAQLLHISKANINIKATTNEKMGFVGRGEGVAVHSVANLKFYDWAQG